MTRPSSFDYLRAYPTLEEIAFACRVPRPLRSACRALCYSSLFALCAWTLESVRLHRAAQVEQVNAKRYAQQLGVLAAAKIHEKRARLLTGLDRQVRAIAASGRTEARRLAALSADLPENVWVTSITPERTGVTLEGRTRDLTGVSSALVRLNADPLFSEPSLLSAQAARAAAAALGLRFSLHVGEAGT